MDVLFFYLWCHDNENCTFKFGSRYCRFLLHANLKLIVHNYSILHSKFDSPSNAASIKLLTLHSTGSSGHERARQDCLLMLSHHGFKSLWWLPVLHIYYWNYAGIPRRHCYPMGRLWHLADPNGRSGHFYLSPTLLAGKTPTMRYGVLKGARSMCGSEWRGW